MNSEGVPLRRREYEPEVSTVIQYTMVDKIDPEPPKDHIIWSLISFVWSNFFCLGLAALIFSVKSRDRKVVGDLEGARRYGSTACSLNIAATVLASVALLLFIIIFIAIHIVSAQRWHYYY